MWWGSGPPNVWVRIGAFNLAMAIVVGAFFGIGARSLLLVFIGPNGGRGTWLLRAMKGAVFLALGGLYTLFAWPMLVWDRPARLFAVITVVFPPLVAGLRRSNGRAPHPLKLRGRLAAVLLKLVLFAAAILTLLRAGFITLKADRVSLLLEITGETKSENGGGGSSGRPAREPGVTAHHVILWLPDGTPATDLWVPGGRVAFRGKAVLFSRRLNAMGFPNLFRFLEAANGALDPRNADDFPLFSVPLPGTGPLAVNPLWRPIQAGILRAWPRAPEGAWPLWEIRVIERQSPFYPLVDEQGQPLKARFLLDVTLEGVPTSRGSSPLEKP